MLRKVVSCALLVAFVSGNTALAQNFRLSRPGQTPMQQGSVSTTESSGSAQQSDGNGSENASSTFGGTVVDGQRSSVPLQMSVEKNTTVVRLSAGELATLGRHDIVLCIDKSSSMATPDCPSFSQPGYAISRWQWCGEQTMDVARQAQSVLPEGLSVVLFSWIAQPFPHVDVRQIPQIFMTNFPSGITNEGAALRLTLEDYFNRRKSGKTRPMIIAIITDGLPTNPIDVKEAIFEATKEMKNPDELHFTFLQIGQDPEGVAFVRDMSRDLSAHKAKYDVVTGETFDQLLKTGLAKALVDCVSGGHAPEHD